MNEILPHHKTCRICGTRALLTAALGICADCIRSNPAGAMPFIKTAHRVSRKIFDLPSQVPDDPEGVQCPLCANECRIQTGEKGYCGLRTNVEGTLIHLGGTAENGVLECYYDPLPTNCVAEGFCGVLSDPAGHKRESSEERGRGHKNLAVFYGACNFNCLFCQNWQYRTLASRAKPVMTARELAGHVDDKTSCVCYFGAAASNIMRLADESSATKIGYLFV